jgi:hypothetical protein
MIVKLEPRIVRNTIRNRASGRSQIWRRFIDSPLGLGGDYGDVGPAF